MRFLILLQRRAEVLTTPLDYANRVEQLTLLRKVFVLRRQQQRLSQILEGERRVLQIRSRNSRHSLQSLNLRRGVSLFRAQRPQPLPTPKLLCPVNTAVLSNVRKARKRSRLFLWVADLCAYLRGFGQIRQCFLGPV